MSIKKLQTIIVKICEGPVGGVILAALLVGALLVYFYTSSPEVPFIYQQF